tara:strand:+ start:451 stop:1617 length:1167 start_codon:yes stop_codon:yes gene_type:complete
MKYKMIGYGKQTIEQDDIDAIIEVFNTDLLTQGPAVEKFEKDLQDFFDAKHVCAVSSGTAALHLAGLALGWGPKDIVITSPLTFLATANCIVYSGATPDFVDINPVSYTIDSNKVEEKVKNYLSIGKNVKAIIGIDYAGHPCDWKGLRQIADKYDLQLINDNCHALGARYLNDKCYAVKYADIVTQSYHPVKHFTTGEGGAVLTNNLELDEKIRCLRTHGINKNYTKLDEPWYYNMDKLGFNYRITDFQCALGSSQLKKLDSFVEKRHRIAKRYNDSFVNIKNLIIPAEQSAVKHSYHLYPLQIDFEKIFLTKVQFFEKMKKAGINLQVHYIPIHLQPYYRENFGFQKGDFTIAESFYYNELSLPIYPDLSVDDISLVIDNILENISK